MDPDARRRDLLRTGAGLAVAAALGLAGCTEDEDPEDTTTGGTAGATTEGETTGAPTEATTAGETIEEPTDRTTEETTEETTTDPPAAGVPGYARWLPSPSALGSDRPYLFGNLEVAAVRESSDQFDEGRYRTFEQSFSRGSPLPPLETVETSTTLFDTSGGSITYVVRGSFSADRATTALTEDGNAEAVGEYGGFTVYVGDGVAGAVREGVAVVAQGSRVGRERVELVIDADRGGVERYAATDDDAATLMAEMGGVTSVIGTGVGSNVSGPYDPEILDLIGIAADLEGDTTRFREVHVYTSVDVVDEGLSREAATSESGTLAAAEEVSVSRSGRVVTVAADAPTTQVSPSLFGLTLVGETGGGGGGGGETETPQAAFDFEYDAEEEAVTITHNGGDTFTDQNTGALQYGGGTSDLRTWSLPVSAGDSVTLDPEGGFESGDGVLVVWQGPEGENSAIVASYTIP